MIEIYNDFLTWLKSLGLNAAGRFLSAGLTLIVGVVLINLATKLLRKALERSRLEKAAHSMIVSVAKIALYLLVIMSAASALGIDITGVLALASVLTLAVSLAMQTLLTNFVGGLTILSTQPFHSGDYVDIGGQSGTVQEISMTYTRLITPDNKAVSIPNSTVSGAQIVNYSSTGTRRVDVNIGASYDADAEAVIQALLRVGAVEKVLADPAPFAGLTDYGDSTINYCLRVWVKTEDYWDVYFLLNRRIQQIFAEENIEISYPHLNVHLDR